MSKRKRNTCLNMCGIIGFSGLQGERAIKEMNEIQRHRGPDDEGYFFDAEDQVTLAMRRLSILDITGGHQPMSSTDGTIWIVFNGEIYNAPELRVRLAPYYPFKTDHSDTEVLIALYAKYGIEMLQHVNGMFAFVIYDRQKDILFCARDHMGIKPLYYTYQDGRFAFASELKSLLQLPFVKRALNRQSFFHYMSLMYVPGEDTIIEGIKRLPAAHYLVFDLRNKTHYIKRWWTPQFSHGGQHSVVEWSDKIRITLQRAVDRWTLSDVPIACSLSGGLDSSAIVGLLASQGHTVKTYSVGFTGTGEEDWNELPRARAVAKKWGTDHHELILNPETLLEDLLLMIYHLDEPYGGGLPSWFVFKFMSKDVKVGLTGTGGDELFGNYGKWRFLEGRWWRRSQGAFDDFRKKFFGRFYYLTDAEKRALLVNEAGESPLDTAKVLHEYYVSLEGDSIRDRVAYTDISTQLPEEFLMMTDRFSMAHSLEARTPFLDRELVELVFSIPAAVRTKRHDLKYLLREAIHDILPPELLYAPKKGFVIPLQLWLRGSLRPLAEYLLHPRRLQSQGIFRPEFYAAFVEPHLAGRIDHTSKLWAALMFQLWYYIFIESHPVVPPSHAWRDLLV